VTRETAEEICRPPAGSAVIRADPSLVPQYRDRHRAFRELYLSLRDNFRHRPINCLG
jgi:hypothetical protein